jgi:hypothetical protein
MQLFVWQEHVLRQLAGGELPAVQEVHARLLQLYDDVDIAHMPSDLIQGQPTQHAPSTSAAALAADDGDGARLADCDQFVANAAMAGDTFAWHIDADPAGATSHTPKACGHIALGWSCPCSVDSRGRLRFGAAGFPPSQWADEFGDYCNGEPGRPLFASLILYLDDEWRREWDAETLFLDTMSDVGIVVRPKRCRAILMDQVCGLSCHLHGSCVKLV